MASFSCWNISGFVLGMQIVNVSRRRKTWLNPAETGVCARTNKEPDYIWNTALHPYSWVLAIFCNVVGSQDPRDVGMRWWELSPAPLNLDTAHIVKVRWSQVVSAVPRAAACCEVRGPRKVSLLESSGSSRFPLSQVFQYQNSSQPRKGGSHGDTWDQQLRSDAPHAVPPVSPTAQAL